MNKQLCEFIYDNFVGILKNMAGVYIHIPFCKQLCSYCDFHFSVSLLRAEQMHQAMLRDMELQSAYENLPKEKTTTLYFGGGTPTVYSPKQIAQLGDKAINLFMGNSPNEWTVEANPDDLTLAYLKELRSFGVNRLSVGIQSFIDRDLQWMKRRHSAEEGKRAVKLAQDVGFNNISIDLIYALPSMNLQEWEYNINEAIKLNIQHISAYHLITEEKTIIGKQVKRGLFTPVSDDVGAEHYQLLRTMLIDAGFEQYEVANFAKPNYYSVHNSSYWKHQAYIGIGPSAHAYNGKYIRTANVANNIQYIKAILENKKYREQEILTDTDIYNEKLLTTLRTKWGLNIEQLDDIFKEYFLKHSTTFLKQGSLTKQGSIYKIPAEYFIISDSIVRELFITLTFQFP